MRSVLLYQVMLYGGLSLCMFIGSVLFGETVISLVYGDQYAPYAYVLVLYVLVVSMLVITFPMMTVIVRLKQLKRYNYLRISAGVVGTLAAFSWCHSYGAVGAVGACLVGWIIALIIAVYIVLSGLKKQEKSKRGLNDG